MFCSYCGGKLDQETRFCANCGKEISSEKIAPVPESPHLTLQDLSAPAEAILPPPIEISKPPVKKHMGKYLLFAACGTASGALLLAVILLAAGVFSPGSRTVDEPGDTINGLANTIEGPGFSKPEDAAKAYLKALRDQDMDEMMAAFAVESYVDNFDFEASLDQMDAYYSFNYGILVPITNDYTRQLNIAARRDYIAHRISVQFMYFNTPTAFNNDCPVMLEDAKEIKNFIEKYEMEIDNNIFDDLVITGTLAPEDISDFYLDEQNQDSLAKQAKVYGVDADDFANVAVTFKADGKTWIFCPQLLRYGGKWYLESSEGNLSCLLNMELFTGGIAPF